FELRWPAGHGERANLPRTVVPCGLHFCPCPGHRLGRRHRPAALSHQRLQRAPKLRKQRLRYPASLYFLAVVPYSGDKIASTDAPGLVRKRNSDAAERTAVD